MAMEGLGAQAVGAAGEQPQVGVGGLGAGIGQAVHVRSQRRLVAVPGESGPELQVIPIPGAAEHARATAAT